VRSSWKVYSRLAGEENSRLVRNRKVHCCVHKELLLDAVLGQKNPLFLDVPCWSKIHCIFRSPYRPARWLFFVIYLMTLSVSRTVFSRWQDNGERWIVKDFEASGRCQMKLLSRNFCLGTEESNEKLWSVTATPVCSWTSDISFKSFLLRILCTSVSVVSSCHLSYFSPWLGHPNEVWWNLGLPVTKHLIMLFRHRSCYCHSPMRYVQMLFFVGDRVLHQYKTTSRIMVHMLIFSGTSRSGIFEDDCVSVCKGCLSFSSR